MVEWYQSRRDYHRLFAPKTFYGSGQVELRKKTKKQKTKTESNKQTNKQKTKTNQDMSVKAIKFDDHLAPWICSIKKTIWG